MIAFCDCGQAVEWEFVGEHTDEHGRIWETYRCPECGAERSYAVG